MSPEGIVGLCAVSMAMGSWWSKRKACAAAYAQGHADASAVAVASNKVGVVVQNAPTGRSNYDDGADDYYVEYDEHDYDYDRSSVGAGLGDGPELVEPVRGPRALPAGRPGGRRVGVLRGSGVHRPGR